MRLHEKVAIARTFQQSTRIDVDLETAGALNGFVFHNSAESALQSMTRMIVESKQRAFTLTGPYGVGKSSLSLLLCSSVSKNLVSNQNQILRKKLPCFDEAFPSGKSGWLVIPLVGYRGNLVTDLRKVLLGANQQNQADRSGRDVIRALIKRSEERPDDGVLLVIDEMGKYLEEATEQGGDIHFFQELAESASRTKGRLVILGILHQSFEQYASRLEVRVREEWAKVQGRYVDIPLVTAVEEVVDLIGKAIDTNLAHPKSFSKAKVVADSIRRRRTGVSSSFANRLDACWPIHPATAALLGPLSRWRFGQNERSVFGFLGSSEPEGFQDFLKSTEANETTYEPWRLWNYLKVNLESAIMASPDSHKWTQALESVELCEARGTSLHVKLAKTIAVIEMFRHGSGLMPETKVLKACIARPNRNQLERALKDIENWSAVIFRNHFNAWAIYAGSDFDIEASLQKELVEREVNIEDVNSLAQLRPVIAKKHYHETGTLRWFGVEIVSSRKVRDVAESFNPKDGMAGIFLLVLPSEDSINAPNIESICKDASKSVVSDYPVAVGFPSSCDRINSLGKELNALDNILKNRPELEGDSVARREIEARITLVKAKLQASLQTSLHQTKWFVRGRMQRRKTMSSLSPLASNLADKTFCSAPNVHTELVNKEKPSANGQAAIRKLLYKMVNHPDQKNLAIEGFPPELGIYKSVLEALNLHGKTKEGTYEFIKPAAQDKKNKQIFQLWEKTESVLKENQIVSISYIYNEWMSPPFGVRRGLLPVIAMIFIMTNRTSVAVYSEGMFQTEINELVVDLLLQKNSTVQLRWVDLGKRNRELLDSLHNAAEQINGKTVLKKPLEVARVLVHFVLKLPPWTKRTSTISNEARKIRSMLLSANDPIQALFVDLPLIFEADKPRNSLGNKQAHENFGKFMKRVLQELKNAYPEMIANLYENMFEILGQNRFDLNSLRNRAKVVAGTTGNFRLEAFSTRLKEFSNPHEDMESIASLALNKPVHDWSDKDPDAAMLEIANFVLIFRQAETLAQVKKRKPTSEAIALMLGTGENGNTMVETFNITEYEKEEAAKSAQDVISLLDSNGGDDKQKLVILSEALRHIINL